MAEALVTHFFGQPLYNVCADYGFEALDVIDAMTYCAKVIDFDSLELFENAPRRGTSGGGAAKASRH